jgi:hypothetical protein
MEHATNEVIAAQFAAGRSIARLAEEWERDPNWIEGVIRVALLRTIPERDGGLKPARAEQQAERSEELERIRRAQGVLEL